MILVYPISNPFDASKKNPKWKISPGTSHHQASKNNTRAKCPYQMFTLNANTKYCCSAPAARVPAANPLRNPLPSCFDTAQTTANSAQSPGSLCKNNNRNRQSSKLSYTYWHSSEFMQKKEVFLERLQCIKQQCST